MNIFKTLLENDQTVKLEAWKASVKKAHPDHASQIQFKGKTNVDPKTKKSISVISAEVNGLDRCFGVFNLDDDNDEGEVLS